MKHPSAHTVVTTTLEDLIPRFSEVTEWLQRVHDELVSLNGIRRDGALVRPILNGASLRLSTSAGQVLGYSVRETSGAAAAVLRLRDGSDTSGDLVATIQLPANASATVWLAPHGVAFVQGLYAEVVSGALEGVVYLGPSGR